MLRRQLHPGETYGRWGYETCADYSQARQGSGSGESAPYMYQEPQPTGSNLLSSSVETLREV